MKCSNLHTDNYYFLHKISFACAKYAWKIQKRPLVLEAIKKGRDEQLIKWNLVKLEIKNGPLHTKLGTSIKKGCRDVGDDSDASGMPILDMAHSIGVGKQVECCMII